MERLINVSLTPDPSAPLRLYGYWRSSSSWRIRIALALKGLKWEDVPVHLTRDGGEQHQTEFVARNPQELVPLLEHGAVRIPQSLAICEYLDAAFEGPRLIPEDPVEAAHLRALTLAIACEIQPLNNLRVLQYLENTLGIADEPRRLWYQHWITGGFGALENALTGGAERYCMGPAPGLLDVFLVPQMYNARRFDTNLEPFPRLCAVEAACLQHPAFAETAPDRQPDAEP